MVKEKRTLKLKSLTAEAFAPYGDVIEVSSEADSFPINYGQTTRYNALSRVDTGEDGTPIISIFRTKPVDLPIRINVMERHPLASQTFMPMSCNAYIVVVAPKGDLDFTKLEAFIVRPSQGVTYHKGVWHHYNLVLAGNGDFLVIDRQGGGNNCDEVDIPENLDIVVEK
ncbi:ureidoglycolate lyase [Porticoccus sp. W117]|uniref:ureidoglycolate lyase n=1 Tax=Porticoccus sp. W117 TaxID=3054777 RepID=UPI002597B070|nr:ureidoglycolate lyase [Porticoccus sp. W117]MDM3872334.1 ureidoglycolate lyase [Porticoccus sp. W117]